jgi:lipopolysaccharide export system permease protein
LGLLDGATLVTSVAVRLLDRYILSEWAKVFSLCFASFCGILVISEAYNWIPEFIHLKTSVLNVLIYFLYSIVVRISTIVPISLMVSTVFVLTTMNRNQELAALRAAGVGISRITAPLWWVGGFFTALLILLNAVWVPDAIEAQNSLLEREQFNALRSKGVSVLPKGESDIVSFENTKKNRFWLITRLGLNTGQAFEVSIDSFDEKGRKIRGIKADFAEFKKINNQWVWIFKEGRDSKFNPETGSLIAQPRFTELNLPDYDEDPEVMLFAKRDPDTLSFREVNRFVDQTGRNAGGRNAAYAMRYHSILAAPAICLVVIAVAIPFSVIGGRVSPMVGVAKVFGLFLLFYFISAISNAFGNSGAIPPVLAAWLPVILTILWITPKLRAVN